jgi:hypothetical protein
VLLFLFKVYLTADEPVYENAVKQKKQFKIVLVVDVSPSLYYCRNLINDFTKEFYEFFLKNENNDFNLITFSKWAKIHDLSVPINLNKILSTIEKEFKKNSKIKEQRTYPKHGLGEVFGLVADSFPKKIGAIIFLSDGEDSRTELKKGGDTTRKVQMDLKNTIRSLKNNGFTVFSIFLNTGNPKVTCKDCMNKIAEWSDTEKCLEIKKNSNISDIKSIVVSLKGKVFRAKFSSPVSRVEFVKTFGSLKSQLTIFWLIIVALSVILIAIIIVFLKIVRKKKSTLISLNMLWGKLEYMDESRKKKIIDLSKKSDGYQLKIANSPVLEFSSGELNGKKVITINTKGGRIVYLKENRTHCENQYIQTS